jgi:hypothetical protein
MQNLRSGIGVGIYQTYRAETADSPFSPVEIARIKTYFDNGKYHVRLDFEKDEIWNEKSRIIIYDGTLLVVNHVELFNNSVRRDDAETFAIDKSDTRPLRAHFPFDPGKLPGAVLDVDAVFHVPEMWSSLKIMQTGPGVYVASCRRKPLTEQCEIREDAGYNVTSSTSLADNYSHPIQKATIRWQNSGNVWFVSEIDQIEDYRPNLRATRTLLKYESFQPNVSVPPEMFQFNALQLSKGGRILDRRRETDGGLTPEIRNLPTGKVKTQEMDDLAKHLDALPRKVPRAEEPARRSWNRPFLIAGACISAAGVVVLALRALRRKG